MVPTTSTVVAPPRGFFSPSPPRASPSRLGLYRILQEEEAGPANWHRKTMIDTWLQLPGETQLQLAAARALKNVLIIQGDAAKSASKKMQRIIHWQFKGRIIIISVVRGKGGKGDKAF